MWTSYLLLAFLSTAIPLDLVSPVHGQKGNRYCPGVKPQQIKTSTKFSSRQVHNDCNDPNLFHFRSFDGRCTHPGKPYSGSAKTPLYSYFNLNSRVMAGDKLPNPRRISNVLCYQDEESVIDNDYKLTEFATFFGQFLDHNIVMTSNDMENTFAVQNISLPSDDPRDDISYIKFNRNVKANRQGKQNGPGWNRAINVLPSAIDLFGVYGNEALSKELRHISERDGRLTAFLRTFEETIPLLPRNDEKINSKDRAMNAPKTDPSNYKNFFIAGDSRCNENPQLTALHTLFLRNHNRLVAAIDEHFNEMKDDEWLFQSARRVNQAYFQSIVYNEYLPAMIGWKLADCRRTMNGVDCFDPRQEFGVSDIFSVAAFRLGHSMVGSFVNRKNNDLSDLDILKLEDTFFSGSSLLEKDLINPYFRGAAWNQAQKIDRFIVEALRNNLFEHVPGEDGIDLAALNIQRGRDANLPSFADVKKRFLNKKVRGFKDITKDKLTIDLLQQLYKKVQDVDLWVGLLCEDHDHDAPMGPTSVAIWIDEFERLREGDAYFYLNRNMYDPELLQFEELSKILNGKGKTMKDLIFLNDDGVLEKMDNGELPKNIWKME